jgi:propanol-preferring alcohol dehydrogenase
MVLDVQAPIEQAPLVMTEIAAGEPGPGELRIRMRACGVCRTDLHVVEGDLPLAKTPIVPGHQVVGIVDAIGPRADDVHIGGAGKRALGARAHSDEPDGSTTSATLSLGDRVGVAWLHSACGRCAHCARDAENLCERARFTGWSVDGGFAESLLAPAEFVYALPSRVSDIDAAPLLCAGVVGYRALVQSGAIDRARDTPTPRGRAPRLGIFGFGASGHLTLQAARALGCEVAVFTRDDGHRRLARSLGAAWTGSAEEDPGSALDAAILFAPSGALVPKALERIGSGGTLALAGIHMSDIPALDYERHLYRERVLRSVTAATRADARAFLALAEAANIRAATETFPLAKANEALRAVKESRVRGAAVLVQA